ncbi:MAG: pirin family protein [Fimbriimonadaceae bacterium]
MIAIRKANDRFHTEIAWLDSWHTFSFGDHFDRNFMSFRSLRVINDDIIGAGQGFGMHPHRDMEIVTYMLDGELAHRDSMGNGATIRPGVIQRMSAGRGLMHAEANASQTESCRLLQIWIMPESQALEPTYEDRAFPDLDSGNLVLICSHEGRDGSMKINQDASMYACRLPSGQAQTLEISEGRFAWVQVADGEIALNGESIARGDGAAVSFETVLTFEAGTDSEFLVFDLA